MSSNSTRSRARRVLGVLGSVVGVAVTFVAGVAAGAVLHLDLPVTRRLVATQANAILRSTLQGEVIVERIGHVGLDGVAGIKVRVADPDGIQVLDVTGVRAKTSALAIARSALFDDGPIVIPAHEVVVDHVDANLDTDGTAAENLRLANAFLPRDAAPSEPSPAGRGVRVEAPDVRLGHLWAHGLPPGGQPVDADLHGLVAKAHVDPQRVDAELVRVALQARAIPRGLDPIGVASGRFSMPLVGEAPPVALEARFDGKIGGIATSARGSMSGSRVDAVVDARDDGGRGAQAIVTEVAIRDTLTLHAEVHGDLPRVEAKANVALDRATADASAVVVTGPTTRIEGSVAVRGFDVRALEPSGPKTELGLDATATVALGEGGVTGEAAVDTLPGLVAEQAVPPIELRARLAGKAAQATAVVKDRTMPTTVKVDVEPRADVADGQVVRATVLAKAPDLHRLPVVGAIFGGSAEVDARAKLALPERTIDAKAKLVASRVRDHQLALGKVTAEATVSGTLDRPVIDATVKARELVTGTLPLAKLDASARVVVEGSAISIERPRLEAVRPVAESIRVAATRVKIDGGDLRVDGARVEGVGAPISADVVKSGDDIDGAVDAPAIDLALVARLVGKQEELALRSGTLRLVGKGALRRGELTAGLEGELTNLAIRDVRSANAKVAAAVRGREVVLDLRADVGGTGTLELSSDHLVIDGPATDPRAWQRAHGKVTVAGHVDLARLAAFVPRGALGSASEPALPLADLRGFVTLQGRVGRDSADAPPEVQLHAHTRGLALAGAAKQPAEPIGDTRVEAVAPSRMTGIDVGVDVRSDATSGLTNLAFRVTDARGALVAFDAKTELPYAELALHPERAMSEALAAPISARLVIPPRRLEELPPILDLQGTSGAVEAELEAGGTLLEPRVRLVARGRRLRAPQMGRDARTDLDLALDYDGQEARVALRSAAAGADLLTLSGSVKAKAKDFLAGTSAGAPDWTASVKAHLAGFPLESLPALADQRVRGRVSGDVELTGLHADALARAHIAIDALRVGRVTYEKANLDLEAGRGQLAAKLRVEQKDGFVDASAESGMRWGSELAPSLDEARPLVAKLEAKNFNAAVAQPFLASAIPTLEGRLDAHAAARIVPGAPGAELEGKVTFSDGTVGVAALGDELRRVRATVTLAKDGTIEVVDVSAAGTQGEVRANATAKLDGMRLADAVANIDIPKSKPFSFTLQGAPMGNVHGEVKVKAKQSPDAKVTSVSVEVPRFNVELPQSQKTGIATLEKRENVHVGVYRDGATFVKLPLDKKDALPPPEERAADPSRLEVAVALGRVDVERGNMAKVALGGDIKVSIGQDTRIEGEIRALEGWADVQGKKFEVERATVTFDGEPEVNPVVLATAKWDAPDGTKVYADFVGPVKTGKVVLRSEPGRPQNEILALVLFGTADGVNPRPQAAQTQKDGTQKAAVGVGGGIAAQGLTDALDDMAGIQATARVDTSSANNPRPEIEFQVSSKISVAFGHVLGTPPITEPDRNLAKIEYRFYRNWSLETTVGDRGKGQLDAIWQKRY